MIKFVESRSCCSSVLHLHAVELLGSVCHIRRNISSFHVLFSFAIGCSILSCSLLVSWRSRSSSRVIATASDKFTNCCNCGIGPTGFCCENFPPLINNEDAASRRLGPHSDGRNQSGLGITKK